jgi:N-formylmaleamate deformylase
MSDWQSDDLQVNGLRLHYTRTGGAKPPLVMLHGFSDDGSCWTPLAERFEADYDVIMPDARGHGFSEAPEQGYSPADQAADAKGIITALGLQKPLILGHSMGAATTMALAGLYPDVPGAILLEDPPAWWINRGFQKPSTPEQLAKSRESIIARNNQSREDLIAGERRNNPTWSDAELGPWADSKMRLSPKVVGLFEPSVVGSVDWASVLPRIACPALLITAEVGRGAIVSDEAAAALKKIIPQLQVAHIPNAGHCIHRDRLEDYLVKVKVFLAEL